MKVSTAKGNDCLSEDWKQFLSKVKCHWRRLADDVVLISDDNLDKLVRAIQKQYGPQEVEQIKDQLERIYRSHCLGS
jgi:hypothetical protein